MNWDPSQNEIPIERPLFTESKWRYRPNADDRVLSEANGPREGPPKYGGDDAAEQRLVGDTRGLFTRIGSAQIGWYLLEVALGQPELDSQLET